MVTDYRLENYLQDEIKYSHGPLRNRYKSNRTTTGQFDFRIKAVGDLFKTQFIGNRKKCNGLGWFKFVAFSEFN